MRKLLKQARSKLQAQQISIAWNSLDPPSSFHKVDARSRKRRYSVNIGNMKSVKESLMPHVEHLTRGCFTRILRAATLNMEIARSHTKCRESEFVIGAQSQFVTITGALGTGKTRACEEIVERIRRSTEFQNIQVVDVHMDFGEGDALQPFESLYHSDAIIGSRLYVKIFTPYDNLSSFLRNSDEKDEAVTKMKHNQLCAKTVMALLLKRIRETTQKDILMVVSMEGYECFVHNIGGNFHPLIALMQWMNSYNSPHLAFLPVATATLPSDFIWQNSLNRVRCHLSLLNQESIQAIARQAGIDVTDQKMMRALTAFGYWSRELHFAIEAAKVSATVSQIVCRSRQRMADVSALTEPYTGAVETDKLLLEHLLTSSKHMIPEEHLHDLILKSKVHNIDDNTGRLAIPFTAMARLIETHRPNLLNLMSLDGEYSWRKFIELDLSILAIRSRDSSLAYLDELFPGAYMHSFTTIRMFQTPLIVHAGKEMKVVHDLKSPHDRALLHHPEDDEIFNNIHLAPPNTLFTGRIYLQDDLGRPPIMVMIQHRYSKCTNTAKLEDWVKQMQPIIRFIKGQGRFLPILVFITDEYIPKATQMACIEACARKHVELLVVADPNSQYFSFASKPFLLHPDSN